MTTLKTWKVVADGGQDEVILAVDFDASGRNEARFADLAGHLEPRRTIWETLPQAVATRPDLPAEAYVKQWADEVTAAGRKVTAVFGFCAGSVYAAALAAELEDRQGDRPLIVLFDPEEASALSMYWQFHKVVDQFSAVLPAAAVAAAQHEGQQAQQDSGTLTELAGRLLAIYHRVGEPAYDLLGLDPARRAELAATAGAFLAYLATAEQIDPYETWRHAVAVSSATPTSGLNARRLLNADREVDLVAAELRFNVPHVELLRSPEVARAVSARLDGGA